MYRVTMPMYVGNVSTVLLIVLPGLADSISKVTLSNNILMNNTCIQAYTHPTHTHMHIPPPPPHTHTHTHSHTHLPCLFVQSLQRSVSFLSAFHGSPNICMCNVTHQFISEHTIEHDKRITLATI